VRANLKSLAFLSLAGKRLKHRPGLTSLLILSYALTIGLAVCVPVFADAISMQILQEEIEQKTKMQGCPPFAVRFYAMPDADAGGEMSLEEAAYVKDWLGDTLVRETGLPLRLVYAQNEGRVLYLQPKPGDTRYDQQILGQAQPVLVENIGQHIRVVAGEPFGEAGATDQFAVWIERKYADDLAIQAGESYDLNVPWRREIGTLSVKVAGIWEALDAGDPFWYENPASLFVDRVLTTEAQYRQYVLPLTPGKTYYNYWYYVLDDTKMSFGHAEKYIKALEMIEREVSKRLPTGGMDFSPLRELKQGLQRKASLLAVLFGFSLPLVGVLVYFMASLSATVVHLERQETAILTSRGTGRLQVMGVTLLETAILLVLAIPLGITCGLLLARLMGYTQSFLKFVPRAPTRVHLAAIDWRLVSLGMGVSALSRLVPSWSATRFSVVAWERWSARRQGLLGVARLLLMGFLAVATAYTYYRLTRIGSLGLIGLKSSDPTFDPLLLFAPSLFLLAVALLASELFALLMRPLAWLGKLQTGATGFLSLIGLGREGGQYRTPIYMLVLCLSAGILFASLAKSADTWLMDRRQYEYGADLTFKPRDFVPDVSPVFQIPSAQASLGQGSGQENEEIRALQVPLSDYEKIEGVAKAARVAQYWATIPAQRIPNLLLLGIDRADFPQVCYYRSDYSALSFGELMNRLGATPDGVLLPSFIANQLQISEGDKLPVQLRIGMDTSEPIQFTLVGTFERFPTMLSEQRAVIIANLDHIQMETGGNLLWDIWLRLKPGADGERILEDVSRMGVTPLSSEILAPKIRRDQDRLERVGIFGMLSICFLASAALVSAGLVVYSFASLSSRGFRFAVWQALGLRRSEVIRVVSLEHLIMLLYGLIAGIALGVLATRLYGPYFRLIESVQMPVPPFIPLMDWDKAFWMALVVGGALIVMQGGVLFRVARARVFEILRLGTRE